MLGEYVGDFYLTGHSKGGNLALYAGLINTYRVNSIKRIASFDGMGFPDSYIDKFRDYKKVINYIPSVSYVGYLFNPVGKVITVKTKFLNIYTHDIMTWLIEKNRFKTTLPSKKALVYARHFDNWVEKSNHKEKELGISIIKELFLNDEELDKINSFSDYLKKVKTKYDKLSAQDKKIIKNIITQIIESKNTSK